VKGKVCTAVRGTAHFFSRDGGLNWAEDPGLDDGTAPLLVYATAGLPGLIFSDKNPSQSSHAMINVLQRPFMLASYGIGDETREFRTSMFSNQPAQAVRDYLDQTGLGGKLNFCAVMPAAASRSNEDLTVIQIFTLLADGKALSSALTIDEGAPGEIAHQTSIIDGLATQTKANLRSLHFQPDQRIGWISSGWNDGNEEGAAPAIFQTIDGGINWERLSYRQQYAPWVLYLAMPAFFFAFFATGAAWRDYRGTRVDEGIAGVGTSDSPIGWEDLDVLGLKPLALALSRFVRNANTAPPLTVAVTGPWGTGKSSLMNLIAEDLRQRGAGPVWFNAWHHQKEENILAALLENIRAQAIPPAWRLSGLVFRLRLLALRMGKNLFPLMLATVVIVALFYAFDFRSLAVSLATGTNAVPALTTEAVGKWLDSIAGVGAGALLLVLLKIYGTLNLKPSELMATLRGNAKLADFSAQLGFRYRFAMEFDAAGKALRSSTNPGLVIFIDDLDRCTPSNLMEVLESINFLTTAGPCFIFLGMDEPKVVEIVAKQYDGDQERARQYLKKLINLTIPIPDVDELNSVNLSAGADPAAVPVSPWPKRIRAILRSAPDIGVPALALIAAIGLSTAQLTATAPPETVRTTQQQPSPKSAPGASAPRQDTPGATTTVSIDLPTIGAERLARTARGLPFLGIGLSLLIIILLVARRLTTAREDKVEDSKDFRDALTIWHPAVFAADPTPRGVKRHQNRLRLQAMRLRPPRQQPDILDRLFSRTPPVDDPPDLLINEPTLVALGGIVALCRDIPDWSVGSDASAGLPAGSGPAAVQAKIISKCRIRFEKTFPDDWPPTQASIDAFRILRRSL